MSLVAYAALQQLNFNTVYTPRSFVVLKLSEEFFGQNAQISDK
jgi:hypothetical protein